jgi:immune inhibitor A
MRRTTGLLSISVLLLSFGFSYAVMPTPEVIEKLKAEGKWEEFKALNESAQRRGLDQPDPYRIAAGEVAAVVANLNALVILVDFADNPGNPAVTDSAYFDDLLFSVNTPGQSLNDFYQENSFGNVTVSGDVVGWLRMDSSYAYYVNGQRGLGSYPRNAQKLAEDAVIKANLAGVNFQLYDNDGDNELDGFFVVHAGPGYEETGNLNQIHSHKWALNSPLNIDGVTISNYTMQPEEQGSGAPVNIGVFCHEFGHFFGLPDLYDVDNSSQGLDRWVLMAAGNYAKPDGSSPSHFGVWEKMKLGWISPTNVTSNLVGVSIPQIETDSVAYRLWTGGAGGSQYFLVENRQKTHFDSFLPGEGLMIYHVDDAVGYGLSNQKEWYPGFTSSGHYLVALEQADGLFELEKTSGPFASDNSDPWPGSLARTNFDDLTVPDSRTYVPASTQVAVWNISTSDSLMTANLDVAWSRPNFVFLNKSFVEDGNNNNIPEGGENVNMFVTERNLWKGVLDAQYSVSCDDPDVTFTDSVVLVGTVNSGSTATNITPITFSVAAGKVPRVADFYITVTASSEGYVSTDTVRIDIGPKQILIVDDDARIGPTKSLDSSHIIPVIDTMRVPFARWEVYSAGPPTTLNNYPMVLWYTGNVRTNLYSGSDTLLNPAEITQLQSFLDSGGGLFLTGQQIARYLDSINPAFLNNYLHVDYSGPAQDFFAQGIDGDPITDSLRFVVGGSGGAGNQDASARDLLTPRDSAVAIFTEDTSGTAISDIRYAGAYKVVFLGWGVEGIGDNMSFPPWGGMPKTLLIERVTNWLLATPTAVGDDDFLLPQTFALHQNYPNPFNPSTLIKFNIGSSASHVTLTVFNILGRHVRTLLDSDLPGGTHEVRWDGHDERGVEVGSGVYFYRLESKNASATRKMLLLR